MSEGTMGKYIKDYKVYKCPVGEKGQRVTYFMSHSMATYRILGGSTNGGLVAPRKSNLELILKNRRTICLFDDAGHLKPAHFI